MPKMKAHKGLRKRIRVTARGKIKHRRSFSGHLMSGKSGSRRRALRQAGFLIEPYASKALRRVAGEA